jgi:hypothetical protein
MKGGEEVMKTTDEAKKMPTLVKVTNENDSNSFCLTDCGPSDGCNPDD